MFPVDFNSTRAVCVEKSQKQNPLITGFEHWTFGTGGRRSTTVSLYSLYLLTVVCVLLECANVNIITSK